MRRLLLIGLAGFLGLSAFPAEACRIYTPSADLSVLHREVPDPVPGDVVVAEVQFEQRDAGWAELRRGAPARVVRMVRGDYAGDVVIIRDTAEFRITCYAPVRDGGRGIVLGRPMGRENGRLVIEPIFEGRGRPLVSGNR